MFTYDFTRKALIGFAAFSLSAVAANAASLSISITNHSQSDGLFLTPLYVAFHDGSFDAFNEGEAASAGVELIAEEGSPAGLPPERLAVAPTSQGGVVFGPEGFAGAPVIDPGETASLLIDVDEDNRYFTFLSMVIPSNDTFIGNDNPLAYEIFDAAGAFTGIGDILVYGGDAWDAGTEADNGEGAAFSTNDNPSIDQNGVVRRESTLDFLLGSETVAGTTIFSVPDQKDLLATISISEVSEVPLPAGAPLILSGLGALGFMRWRKKRS